MLKRKKAAVEIQFHWIYVMLIGAALLMFFGMALYQQQKISREKRERETLNSLESVMRTVHAHGGLSEKIDLRTNLKRDCETNSLLLGSAAKQGNTDPIFSPDQLAGTSIMLGTVEWNVGYRASNFLLMTTDEEQFVIVYDQTKPESKALFEKIEKIWPEKIPYEEKQQSEDITLVAKKTKILALNTGATSPNGNVVKIRIDSASDFETGTVQFGTLPPVKYVGIASVLGALFSDNQVKYECSMKNAYKRLALISEVYGGKAGQLPTTASCNYAESIRILSELKAASESKNPDNIYASASQLKTENVNLLKKSCPVIY